MEDIKKTILSESKKGNIVFAAMDGLRIIQLDKFIEQCAEGILYDLNREEATVLTFLPDIKWVNDFAVAKTIKALKAKIDKLESSCLIRLADAQLSGFLYCKHHSNNPTGMVKAMGLTKDEWEQLKDTAITLKGAPEVITEIDNYFEDEDK